MSGKNMGGLKSQDSGGLAPTPISPNAANWVIVIGAGFGLITLLGLFAFAYLSANNSQLCSSFQFQLLAGGFALGAALAGSFIGGGAGAQGQSGNPGFSLVFGLTGGAALLIVTLAVFSFFAPKGCDVLSSQQMQLDIQKSTAELASIKASLQESRSALASTASERDNLAAANMTSKAVIRRFVTGVQAVLPNADELSASLSSVTPLVTQSCSGGPHGTDPEHAGAIRSITADASRRIAVAQSAIANIVASIPTELAK